MKLKALSLSRLGMFAFAFAVVMGGVLASERTARADVVAAYVSGYGGLASPQGDRAAGSSDMTPVLGAQAGVRLLGLEAYGDYTSMGTNVNVERGILALRLGFDFGATRLELRLGGGAIAERGGALTGPMYASQEHAGAVARAGIDLEHRMARALLAGVGVNGETYTLAASPADALQPGSRLNGSDIMASLHLKFELGI